MKKTDRVLRNLTPSERVQQRHRGPPMEAAVARKPDAVPATSSAERVGDDCHRDAASLPRQKEDGGVGLADPDFLRDAPTTQEIEDASTAQLAHLVVHPPVGDYSQTPSLLSQPGQCLDGSREGRRQLRHLGAVVVPQRGCITNDWEMLTHQGEEPAPLLDGQVSLLQPHQRLIAEIVVLDKGLCPSVKPLFAVDQRPVEVNQSQHTQIIAQHDGTGPQGDRPAERRYRAAPIRRGSLRC